MASSIKGTTSESLEDVMLNVNEALHACKRSGLDVEVMATAMILIKENPNWQIEYAIWCALQDWDV